MNSVSICLTVVSFFLSLLLTGAIKQYFSQQLLDIPNDRSSHTQPTPRGGGLGFILAFGITGWLAVALVGYFPQLLPDRVVTPNPLCLWLILTPLAIVGILDDRYNLPASIRYCVQLATAGIGVACFGTFPLPWLTQAGTIGEICAIALTVIGITAFVNFYNFMDGLDGLVASVSALQLAFFAIYLNLPVLWLLCGAILGFLWWNWSPAKIFMGDAGSTVLGATIAIALLNASDDAVRSWLALAVTLPLIGDATYTLIRRLLRRENIFKPHRSHIYQQLHQRGWRHDRVAIVYLILTSLIILGIFLFWQLQIL